MEKSIKNLLPQSLSRFAKRSYLTIRGLYYYGKKYYCPICEHNFRKFLPGGFNLEIIEEKQIIGSGYRENNICPKCQSTDRDRLVFHYLKNKTNIFSSKLKVLHVSPEPALYSVLSKLKNINYITGTKYAEGIYYPDKIESIDLLDLRFDDNDFDIVICNHVLEHIIDDNTAIAELYRVTIPGGKAILQVPISYIIDSTYENESIISEEEREKHFGQFDHVRIYGKDYISRLEDAGFIVEEYNPIDNSENKKELNKIALNIKERLMVGSVPR